MSHRAGYQKHGGAQHAVDEDRESPQAGRFSTALCGATVKVGDVPFDVAGGIYRKPCKRCLKSLAARKVEA